MTANGPAIRTAARADLAALAALERRCFVLDAQSRRSLRHLLTRAHAANYLVELGGAPAGHVCVLFRRNSRLARVYSLAVDPAARGRGYARALLAAAERAALAAGCARIVSEVRLSNQASQTLFASAAYAPVRRLPDYYPDHGGGFEDGMRLEKALAGESQADA